jgi:hypothetical protein
MRKAAGIILVVFGLVTMIIDVIDLSDFATPSHSLVSLVWTFVYQ